MKLPRLTANVLHVLSTVASSSSAQGIAGAEILKETRLQSGTLYPLLVKLEGAGWVLSKWEAGIPSELGRPRKRFYKITSEGRVQLTSQLANNLRELAF